MSFGRLERSQAAQPISEINVTPLVDVMLVLLVIFILTAPLLASWRHCWGPSCSTPIASSALMACVQWPAKWWQRQRQRSNACWTCIPQG
jgi:hypothetical protein